MALTGIARITVQRFFETTDGQEIVVSPKAALTLDMSDEAHVMKMMAELHNALGKMAETAMREDIDTAEFKEMNMADIAEYIANEE